MKYAIVLIVLGMCSGCMWAEQMTKSATDAALDAVEARVKIIPGQVTEIAREYKDQAVEAAVEYAAKKSVEYGRAGMLFVIRQAELDPMSFDADGDGMLSDTELNFAVNAARESDKIPWWLQLLLYSGAGGALFTTVKTGRRYLNGPTEPKKK